MQKKNINRKKLANKVYEYIGFTKVISENIVNDIFNIIEAALEKHDKIKISSFGTFSKRKKNSRIGRNPKTKETKIILARNVITFKPANIFKKKLNK
tara:strand:- start:441 stop:731 length:291 start_codon:yes stop_codon:yes gene_type:complete